MKKAFAKPINSFADYAKLVTLLMADGITKGTLVDVFLQYQWTIKSGQTQTYLELPKNMKDGSFLTISTPAIGEWEEIRDKKEGLKYIDSVGGAEHRFKRDNNYLESNKAIQQKDGVDNADFKPKAGGTATASTW